MEASDLLIVIDVQNGFVNAHSEHVVNPIAGYVRNWISSGGRVVMTRFVNAPGSQWERLIQWKRLREAPETDLHPALADVAATSDMVRVVEKHTYTSLTPEVESLLTATGAVNVFMCGIATDGCVLKTAVDLFERGLRPVVLSDLCASHAGRDVHEAGLMLLRRFIGRDQVVAAPQP